MHHVNLYEAKTGVVLKEHMVAEKEGELTQVEAFLTPLLLQGRIISADALYTQKRFCQSVLAARRRLPPVCQREPTDLDFRFVPLLWRASSRLSGLAHRFSDRERAWSSYQSHDLGLDRTQ